MKTYFVIQHKEEKDTFVEYANGSPFFDSWGAANVYFQELLQAELLSSGEWEIKKLFLADFHIG